MRGNVFVVAPHSYCANPFVRDCDRAARLAVRDLKKYDTRNLISEYYLSDRLRAFGDYNRDETFKSEWRNTLRRAIMRTKPRFLLEVHSFPERVPLSNPIGTSGWTGADLILFESPMNRAFVRNIAQMIVARDPDLDIRIVQAGDQNSIMSEFARFTPHLLVEFNEEYTRGERSARALLSALEELISGYSIEEMADSDRANGITQSYLAHILSALIVAVIVIALFVIAWQIFSHVMQLRGVHIHPLVWQVRDTH